MRYNNQIGDSSYALEIGLCLHMFILALYPFQVTASSWLNDLKDQVQQTRFLNVVYRSVSSARDKVAGAGTLLSPVSSKTQVRELTAF